MLSQKQIKEIIERIVSKSNYEFKKTLFESYACGVPTRDTDSDLLVSRKKGAYDY